MLKLETFELSKTILLKYEDRDETVVKIDTQLIFENKTDYQMAVSKITEFFSKLELL